MQTFLSEVAERLYEKYGDEISSLSILFPSQRARLFFADALSHIASRPLWAPKYLSIDDIMSDISELRSVDKLRLVAELYGVYSKYHKEDFDRFYHWGELLVADFDMIDKYCVDASRLFRNISDLKELEQDLDYLTPEQLQIVREFWRAIGEEQSFSEQKKRFVGLWRTLGSIYEEYRAHLRKLGIGYTGMIYRDAVERIERDATLQLPDERYVFAGFNALSECEMKLLRYMATNYSTDFFWDYDDYYFRSEAQEAGVFIRRNLSMLPSDDTVSHDNLRNIRSIDVVATSTAVAQCHYAVSLLREIAGKDADGRQLPLDKDTAVVLTDENLLMPLLYALPEELGRVNVTMGYPLRNTPTYALIERLLDLQTHVRAKQEGITFYHIDVDGLLSHPYIAELEPQLAADIRAKISKERIFNVPADMLARTPLLSVLFRATNDWRSLVEYLRDVLIAIGSMPVEATDATMRSEYLAVAVENVSQLLNMIGSCGVELSLTICRKLVRRHLQGVRIPFEGKPLEGLQIMGILETRNLDFRNVLILSMTDSNFPGNRTADSSFVPYNLRYAYGLPTPEHHEGVYGYYFYRLIQRAERVAMLYCAHSDKRGSGEPSRYIRQLQYESEIPISYTDVGVDVRMTEGEPIVIEKDERVMERLHRYVDGVATMSPTAFSRYVKCPMQFYFASVARLRPESDLTEDVDNQTFGNIFHAAAESLYGELIGDKSPAARLSAMRTDGSVDRVMDEAIREFGFATSTDGVGSLSGEIGVVREILTGYLRDNVMRYDASQSGYEVLELEATEQYAFPFECNGEKMAVAFEGKFDRIDRRGEGLIRVIDYKTGAKHLSFKNIEDIFFGEAKDRQTSMINTFIYAMILYHARRVDTQPALYFVRTMANDDYTPLIEDCSRASRGDTYATYEKEFESAISKVFAEMFDRNVPFRQCDDEKTCQMCDFADICIRGKE